MRIGEEEWVDRLAWELDAEQWKKHRRISEETYQYPVYHSLFILLHNKDD